MNNDHFIRPEALWKEVGLRAEQTVVHLGSGAGFYIIPAAKIVGRHGRAIAIDIRSDMLTEVENRARQKGVENVKTMRANLENEPGSDLPDNTADWVLVANILHQSDPQRILREAHRVCAMNGHIVVVEWNTDASPFGPPAEKRLASQETEKVAASLGLRVTKQFTPSAYHYGLILAKT